MDEREIFLPGSIKTQNKPVFLFFYQPTPNRTNQKKKENFNMCLTVNTRSVIRNFKVRCLQGRGFKVAIPALPQIIVRPHLAIHVQKLDSSIPRRNKQRISLPKGSVTTNTGPTQTTLKGDDASDFLIRGASYLENYLIIGKQSLLSVQYSPLRSLTSCKQILFQSERNLLVTSKEKRAVRFRNRRSSRFTVVT